MLKNEIISIKRMLNEFGLEGKTKECEEIITFAELPTTTYEQARRKVMRLYDAIYLGL